MPEYNHRSDLRATMRLVLKLVPRDLWVTREFIHAKMKLADPTADDEAENKSVLRWLDDKGHVESRENQDTDKTEWRLTELGRQRAN